MSSMDNLDKIGSGKSCRVIVHRARNLKPRGKDTKSSPFVTICLGKEKFATSVIEKSQNPEWNEDCELMVRPQDSKLEMTVLHQDFFLERFLGRVEIPLMEIEAAPRRSIRGWYRLQGKTHKHKKEEKTRGELEITAQMKGDDTNGTILHTSTNVKNLPRPDIHPLRKSSSTPYIASTNPFEDDNSIASTDSQRSSTPIDTPGESPRGGLSEPHKSPLSRLQPGGSPQKEPSPLFQRHGMGRKIVRTSIRKEKLPLDRAHSSEPRVSHRREPNTEGTGPNPEPNTAVTPHPHREDGGSVAMEPFHASTPNLLDPTPGVKESTRRGSIDSGSLLERQESYSSTTSNGSSLSHTLPAGLTARFRRKTVSSQDKPTLAPRAENGGAMKRVEVRADNGNSPRAIVRTVSEECLSKSAEKLEAEEAEKAAVQPTKRISYKPAARSARRAKATSQYYPHDVPSSPPPHTPASLPSSPVYGNNIAPSVGGQAGGDAPDCATQFATHPYQSLSKEELIKKVTDLEMTVKDKDRQIAQQERYIDELLLKVITASPGLLDQGYQPKPSIKARPPVQRYQARRQEVIL